MRRDRLYKIYPLLALGVFAAATSWLDRIAQPPDTLRREAASASPDMTVEQFTLQRFDQKGHQQFIFSAAGMRHFAVPDRTEIEQPALVFLGRDAPVNARALRGTVSEDGETVHLAGDVVVTRAADSRRKAAELRTEALTVWPETERVVGEVTVHYAEGPNRITAGNFSADNLDDTLQLGGGIHATLTRSE